jgi:tetratricopeptide (TPR) repeat protein
MKRLFLLVLFVCVAVPAPAADKWTRVQSKNFTLVGNATENEIRDVAEGLEVFRTAYSRFFKMKEGSSVATTVIVFRSDQAFKPFKPVYKGKPANVAGYFQSGPDMNFIALAADMQTPRVIYHEYVHRLMADTLGSLPPWFQEGFAECFSTLEIEGKDKKVRLGRAIAEHVALLNERSFMPLERLFAVENGSPDYNENEKQGLFYAESWAFVHYMMFDSEQRRNQFNTFLADIGHGVPAAKAFQDTFNMELSAFQKVFEAYIQQRVAWNLFEVPTPAGLNRSKDMTSRVISEGQAEFYLGDLLLHLGRLPEAESHLTKAVELEPKLGVGHASMGRLLIEKDKKTEALPYLKRATELDPENYLMHYYYASLLHGQSQTLSESDRATLRQELQRTIELAPQFVEATEMLASENLARNTDIPQTVDLLVKAIEVAPRDYLVLQLAYALSRTQQRETARPLARSLLAKPGLEPQIRQSAQSLLEFLDRSATANRAVADAPVRRARPDVAVDTADITTPELRRPERVERIEPDSPSPVQADRDQLAPGTTRIRGVLTALDCRDGVTLSLVVDGKTVKLHSDTPTQIKFTSFNSTVTGTIACGSVPGNGVPASIVYQPKQSAGSIGEPLAVDFVDPAAEKLDAQKAELPSMPGTSVVTGLLTMLECSNGLTVAVNSDGKTLYFHADTTTKVSFMNGPGADGSVNCGAPIPAPGFPVTVLYRPLKSGDALGEPVVVQFQRPRTSR